MTSPSSSSYYGAFFWLSLVAFLTPLFVAYRAFEKVQPTIRPVPNPDASGVDHAIWDYLLKQYVADGKVDYEGIKRDYLFAVYLKQLAGCDPTKLETTEDELALYCNAYNAFVIHGVIAHRIQNSVQELEKDFFSFPEYILANRTWSLNELEHDFLRPTFKEPRLHMALVCAAISCPSLRPEAYVGDRLEKQLEDQARLFCNNPKHVYFDETKNRIMVNSILKWYGQDFAAHGGFLRWIAERTLDESLKIKLLEADQQLIGVGFIPYDWSLNSQRKGISFGGNHQFGSGTIANE